MVALWSVSWLVLLCVLLVACCLIVRVVPVNFSEVKLTKEWTRVSWSREGKSLCQIIWDFEMYFLRTSISYSGCCFDPIFRMSPVKGNLLPNLWCKIFWSFSAPKPRSKLWFKISIRILNHQGRNLRKEAIWIFMEFWTFQLTCSSKY